MGQTLGVEAENISFGQVSFQCPSPADLPWIRIDEIIHFFFPGFFGKSRVCSVKSLDLAVVEVNHASHVARKFLTAGIIGPGIPIRDNTKRKIIEDFGSIALLVSQGDEPAEAVIALTKPIAMSIRRDGKPVLDSGYITEPMYLTELFFSA